MIGPCAAPLVSAAATCSAKITFGFQIVFASKHFSNATIRLNDLAGKVLRSIT